MDGLRECRIGHYFAALVEFWLRWCPVLNATKVLARQQVTAEVRLTCGPPALEGSWGSDRAGKEGETLENKLWLKCFLVQYL